MAGEEWTAEDEKSYCHGGVEPEQKGIQDGCAYLWNIWGGISYYGEVMFLISKGMKAPEHWTIDDWRVATSVANEFERIAYEERSSGQ
jgi:hypothetical protein